jgi:adenylate kinase family enzyme
VQRLAVVGTTGSGKTVLAARLAERLCAPHIELDALHWGPNWMPLPREQFRARTDEATRATHWVADGNYSEVRDLVWGRADTLVWLEYPFAVVLGRLLSRTAHRVIAREELWNGNRESWRGTLFSRDSLLVWLFKTHWSRRKKYEALLQTPQCVHLQVVRLRSPKATERWLVGIGSVE